MKKIAFAGTDGRTLLCAWVVATATSETCLDDYQGVVVRGTPAMPRFVEMMKWPVTFVPTDSNSVEDYAQGIIAAMEQEKIDYLVPMPEALLFQGLVDRLEAAGLGRRVLGLAEAGAFIEGDKLACKALCREAGIPVADAWVEADARDYSAVLATCLTYIDRFGGAVLKYPYSAGGKGARIILNTWDLRQIYDGLIKDYREEYRGRFGRRGPWPLLIESLMAGVEISFTILVDGLGNYQILPTAMDYPERFPGPPSSANPITGGTGAISPHPMESQELMAMAGETIAKPLIAAMAEKNILRPCVLYPGCFVSLGSDLKPTRIRVSEVNIRPGEPEIQPVARRLRNLGALIEGALEGHLDRISPEVREDQLALSVALMTGPGGPDGQKGYPWSCTKGEPMEIDTKYMRRKGIQVIPSAMAYDDAQDVFKSDGTRVVYLNANLARNAHDSLGTLGERLRNRLLAAFNNGKIRVIPREDPAGNRLALREDIGSHYGTLETLFPKSG